jgi:hypothetical protein
LSTLAGLTIILGGACATIARSGDRLLAMLHVRSSTPEGVRTPVLPARSSIYPGYGHRS